MQRISARSADALETLYDRYSQRAYRVAQSVCHDSGRAEEAVQEAFVSIWRSASTYQSQQGTVATWLLAIVRYRAIDIARRNGAHAARRASEDALATLAGLGDEAELAVSRSDAEHLLAPLAKLPEAQLEVITLAFYGQLTHTEIAAHLGLPPGTVKGRMRLGLEKLRESLASPVESPQHAAAHGRQRPAA